MTGSSATSTITTAIAPDAWVRAAVRGSGSGELTVDPRPRALEELHH
jgi:hypothetical protein